MDRVRCHVLLYVCHAPDVNGLVLSRASQEEGVPVVLSDRNRVDWTLVLVKRRN